MMHIKVISKVLYEVVGHGSHGNYQLSSSIIHTIDCFQEKTQQPCFHHFLSGSEIHRAILQPRNIILCQKT